MERFSPIGYTSKSMAITPLTLVFSFLIGILSAYLAQKRGKNPYFWFAIGMVFGIFGIFAIFFADAKKKPAATAVKPAPVFTIHGPADKFWYYLDPANQQQGPMSRDALSIAWKEGKIDLATYVWHEELPDWKPLKETLKEERV